MKIRDEYIVFSGDLLCMSKKRAKALVYSLGGRSHKVVNQKTTILVTGTFTINHFSKRVWSKELMKAKSMILAGHSIQIIDEKQFLILANEELVKQIRFSY